MCILHLPTFFTALKNAAHCPQGLPKSFEALIASFYFACASPLKSDECERLFGMPKSLALSRYRNATRQALIDADVVSTSNPMTLQAFAMFIVGNMPGLYI